MLFNSYAFIFVFWPIVLVAFFLIARLSHAYAASWLAIASLGFYAYWNPTYVGLLLASIACNYLFGRVIARAVAAGDDRTRRRTLILAITANLALLAYYKYANFFMASVNDLAGTSYSLGEIILPLGISFFTFTQIAYLVDTYQGKVKESNPVHYTLFVTYFPHLIAGPVLHHKQMMPQFGQPSIYRAHAQNFSIGMAFFSIGLAKKVLLADSFAAYATPIFDAAGHGTELTMLTAWIGVIAYTLQLYFDFSGYSDMAVGISKTFGVDLPFNFNSPYKARNIIEFWRRWHMTLSQFLRDYLYIPLGGNRRGPLLRYINLLVTMLLGGLWHGANWTFVIWGGIHGFYLVVNNLWQRLMAHFGPARRFLRLRVVASTALTFLAVCVAWVFFRSNSTSTAVSILEAMAGMNGMSLPVSLQSLQPYTDWLPMTVSFSGIAPGIVIPESIGAMVAIFSLGLGIIWFASNTQEMVLLNPKYDAHGVLEGKEGRVARQSGLLATGIYCGLLFGLSLLGLHRLSEFLYFQF